MSVMLLAERGKLSLDDPVRKYLPELPDYGVPLTIRHLLTHTSGIPSYTGIPAWRDVNMVPKTVDQKIDLFPAALDAEAPMGLYTYQPDPATDRFPLALISPASSMNRVLVLNSPRHVLSSIGRNGSSRGSRAG